MKLRKITAALLAAIMLVTLIPFSAAAGEGIAPRWTDEGNYDISWYDSSLRSFELDTAADLAGLSYLANENGVNFRNKTIILTADIDLGSYEWRPICDGSTFTNFRGIFDGANHKITGLTIEDYSYTYTGLFGAVLVGTVKNLLVDCNITATNDYVAAIVGYQLSGTISGATADGTINAMSNAAGITGYCGGMVISCANRADITGYSYLAGIAATNAGTIVNCYNIGTITGSDLTGGITAYSTGKVANVYNAGTIAANATSGGVASTNESSGSFDNCYWYGPSSENGIFVDYSNTAEHIYSFGGTVISLSLENAVEDVKELSDALNLWVDANAANYVGLIKWRSAGSTDENGGFPIFFAGYWTDEGRYNTSWYVGHEYQKEYTLKTAAELAGLSALVNATAAGVEASVSFRNKIIYLANDIDLSAYDWQPIADDDSVGIFKGTFAGNYKKITGMLISSNTNAGTGLFGYIDTMGTVRNLEIEGSIDTSTSFVGGVAGYNCGTILNVLVRGLAAGDFSVGGIAGINTGTIDSCRIYGNVRTNSIGGGVVGANYGEFYNCSANGNITGEFNVGGLAGVNKGLIVNCSSVGEIEDSHEVVGGLVGHNITGQIVNCYAVPLNTISADNKIGAIAGINDGELIHCFWHGAGNEPVFGEGMGLTEHCSAFSGVCDTLELHDPCYGSTDMVEIFNMAIDSFDRKGLYYWEDAPSTNEKHGYPLLTLPKSITGVVALNGSAIFGETLVSDISAVVPPDAQASVSYQWQRSRSDEDSYSDIPGATDSSYTLALDDIGSYIRVAVSASGDYVGTINSHSTGPVELATPQVTALTGLTAYVGDTLANVNTTTTADGAYFWEVPVDTSVGAEGETVLTMYFVPNNRGYKIIRNIHTTITVSKTAPKGAPDAPGLAEKTSSSLLVEYIIGQEYSIDGGVTWQQSGLFRGLEPLTNYEILTRKLFNSDMQENSITTAVYYTTLRAPVIASADGNSISVGAQTITSGEQIIATLTGAGMDETHHSNGDVRWLPQSAQIEGKGTTIVSAPSFAFNFAITTLGSYVLEGTFSEQRFDGTEWIYTGNVDKKSCTFEIVEPVVLQEVKGWFAAAQSDSAAPLDEVKDAVTGISQLLVNFLNKLIGFIFGTESIFSKIFVR